MDWKQFTMGIATLIVDFFLYRFTKSQIYLDGLANDPRETGYKKRKYWTLLISFLIAGVFLIIASTHLFNF